ncbi:hypothetical protein J3R82DRAFT_9547 [Butyriboletus roseoflavus]|nr:hypothetical protein J3R82DRAFT_9547 [Butyriboletus roseoflavus]
MAYGLGMDVEEWHELRAQVDDSFWALRIIGSSPTTSKSPCVTKRLEIVTSAL